MNIEKQYNHIEENGGKNKYKTLNIEKTLDVIIQAINSQGVSEEKCGCDKMGPCNYHYMNPGKEYQQPTNSQPEEGLKEKIKDMYRKAEEIVDKTLMDNLPTNRRHWPEDKGMEDTKKDCLCGHLKNRHYQGEGFCRGLETAGCTMSCSIFRSFGDKPLTEHQKPTKRPSEVIGHLTGDSDTEDMFSRINDIIDYLDELHSQGKL